MLRRIDKETERTELAKQLCGYLSEVICSSSNMHKPMVLTM